MPAFGWIYRPRAIAAFHATLLGAFRDVAPHLVGTGTGKDVLLWQAEQQVLGKVLPSWDQAQVGSCVGHGWGRAVQDSLLVQIALGAAEQWPSGEVAREPIYGGSRVQVGHDSSGEGSTGAWAAEWVTKWGVVVYGSDGLDGYYTESRCRQYGSQGCPANVQTMAKLHPVRAIAACTRPQDLVDAVANLHCVAICGNTSRGMHRLQGGWCPKTGNEWPHCECVRGTCLVKGGPTSPWGGDGAFPLAGDVQAVVEQNSWGDYLGSQNATVTLASGNTFDLPQGCYLGKPEERAADIKDGETYAVASALGWAAQSFDWLI